MNESYPGRWWHALPDGRVQCDLCPRDCKLHEGQRGLCFVRKMEQGRMVLTTYGRSSGFCVDPVEKKPLNHFYPGTSILSFGTAGCNLACKFCQNWDISKSREMDRLQDEAGPDTIAQAALRLGCKSVAFTYNDPVIFAEYAMDIADACHARDIETVAVTAGYIHAEPRREFYAKMDAANVDLKAFTDEFYYKICGGRLQPVLDTLVYLVKETSVWTEITTLLIPGKNDSDDELRAMTKWLRAAALHRVSPRLEDDRCGAHACRDAHARARNRAARRPELRLHRQRARRVRRLDLLSFVRSARDPTRLVSNQFI
jgi:pyruvate formate lyase activating enzyme